MLFVAYRLLEGVELWAVINPNLGMDDTRHDYTRDLHAEPPTCALSTGTSTTTMNSTVPSILAPSILRFYPAHVRRAILITLPNHPFLCVLPPPSLYAGTCATRSCAQASCRSCAPAPSLCRPLCRGARWARPLSPSGISQSTPASSLHNAVRRAPSERQSLRVPRLVLGALLCRARGGGQRRAGLHLPAAMRGLQQALPQPRQVTSSARLPSHK